MRFNDYIKARYERAGLDPAKPIRLVKRGGRQVITNWSLRMQDDDPSISPWEIIPGAGLLLRGSDGYEYRAVWGSCLQDPSDMHPRLSIYTDVDMAGDNDLKAELIVYPAEYPNGPPSTANVGPVKVRFVDIYKDASNGVAKWEVLYY